MFSCKRYALWLIKQRVLLVLKGGFNISTENETPVCAATERDVHEEAAESPNVEITGKIDRCWLDQKVYGFLKGGFCDSFPVCSLRSMSRRPQGSFA